MGKKITKKRIAVTACLLIAIPVLAKAFAMTVPYVGAIAEQAAIMSAGITMPEGTTTLMEHSTDVAEDEDYYDSVKDEEAVDTEPIRQGSEEIAGITAPTTEGLGITQEEIDAYSSNDGAIIRQQYFAGSSGTFINIGSNAYIKNRTEVSNDTAYQASQTAPSFTIDLNEKEPQVLIMHTHTTESYELSTRDFFDSSFPSRLRNTERNVVRVGDEIAKQLEAESIGVIHSDAEHDYPSYNGSYDRSRQTVEEILAQYPTIKVVIDVHRDAIIGDDGTRYAPVADINGRNAAQVMIISGCDDGTMDYPNYLQNLSFASTFQRQMEEDYPGFTRPISFAYKFYNQDLTTGSILLEVGGHANSLEEAVYAGELAGKSLAKTLKNLGS